MARAEYEGRAYVRPISRGVVLFDGQQDTYVEDMVPDGYYKVKIVFEDLTEEEQREARRAYIGRYEKHQTGGR